MRITTVNLPEELTSRIDEVARDSERSRSFIIRKLLEHSLTAETRMAALDAVAEQGLAEYAKPRKPAPNASELIAESCGDGRARLDALQRIGGGVK
jgi:predicted transcriptional regulator